MAKDACHPRERTVIPANALSSPRTHCHPRERTVIPANALSSPCTYRHSRERTVIPANAPSFPRTRESKLSCSGRSSWISSSPCTHRHSRERTVIPAHAGIQKKGIKMTRTKTWMIFNDFKRLA